MNLEGKYKFVQTKNGKRIGETGWIKNIIVLNDTRGMNIFLRQLIGDDTYPLEITKAKIGTGTATATAADTNLVGGTVVDNILVAIATGTVNSIELKFFASDLQVPEGVYGEIGLFCENQLFARSVISPAFTKTPGVDTTIVYSISASVS